MSRSKFRWHLLRRIAVYNAGSSGWKRLEPLNMPQSQIIWLIACCLVAYVNARGCPKPEDLPRLYGSRRFFCARVYEHSHTDKYFSCGGGYRNIANEEYNSNIGRHWNDKVSSIVVRPGCSLKVYEHDKHRGRNKEFTGTVNRLKDYSWKKGWSTKSWNDRITSWICKCDFSNKALTCDPKEEYYEVTRCSNPNPGSMRCQHAISRGLSIGKSVTYGKSVSNTVETSMEATFEQIFKVGLKASTTTTYNWSKTNSRTYSKVTTTTVWCDVPAGRTVRLLQVVGRCGDTAVYTGHYECR